MNWSKLKQQIEARFADAVVGRVELRLTSYRHAHDGHGRAWITIDGKEVANMCYWRSLHQGACEPEPSTAYYWDEQGVRRILQIQPKYDGVMSPHVFTTTLVRYLSVSIDEALVSKNFLTKSLAILDQRCGKRRLEALELDSSEHELVRTLFEFRRKVEGLADTIAR